MEKIEKIDRQKRQDRNIALLALEADRSEKKGGPACPDDSELAALLDGQFQGEDRKRLQAHIASCENCRRRCLQVGMALMEVNRSPRRNKTRIYGWASAILAAAACVALFFAMDTTPPWQKSGEPVSRVPAPSATKVRTEAARKTASQPIASKRAQDSLKAQHGKPQPRPVAPVNPVPDGQGDTFMASPGKSRQLRANLPAEMDKKVYPKEQARGEEVTPAASSMLMADKITSQDQARAGEWYGLVREACARGEKSRIIWQALYDEGKSVLTSGTSQVQPDGERLLANIQRIIQSPNRTGEICATLTPLIRRHVTP